MKINRKGSYVTQSDFEEGITILEEGQQKLFDRINLLMNDDYSNMLRLYSPQGVISVLRSQLIAKRQYESVELREIEEAGHLIDLLEQSIRRE